MASTLQSDGIRIIVINAQGEDSWMVSEFIDNAILDGIADATGDYTLEISPSLVTSGDTTLSIIAARSQPLLVFTVEHVNAMEERIVNSERARIKDELERELSGQIVSGLFQAPLWPYLAATEIPLRRIDIQRGWRLQDYRAGSFPATSYAATGDVNQWEGRGMTSQTATVVKSADGGVGSGLAIEYLVNGRMTDLHLATDGYSGLYALYVDNGARIVPEMQFSAIDADKFMGALENPGSADIEGSLVSVLEMVDGQGHIARMLVIPGSGGPGRISFESAVATEMQESPSSPAIGTISAVLTCWIGFGILVLVGNWLFRFSNLQPVHLVSRAIALYPLFILLAMLTAGIWGMGFVIASAGLSRFIAPEGRRLAATGVVLAASFGIAAISWLLAN